MKNFFADPDFQNELRRVASEAKQLVESHRKPITVQLGDSFLFSESVDLPARWVAVLKHKDNAALWYLVAADEFSLVGSCDFELPESHPLAPLAIRCGVGFWAHCDDVEFDRYMGRLDEDTLIDVKERLAEMINGKVPVSEHAAIAEANHEYCEWISELARVADQIEERIQSEPLILNSPVFDTSWTKLSANAEKRNSSLALAADATGQQPSASVPPGFVLCNQMPGELVVLRTNDKLDVVYVPSSQELPPPFIASSDLNVREGAWLLGADGLWTWSQTISCASGRVSLEIGVKKFEIRL